MDFINFLKKGIWQVQLGSLPVRKRILYQALRIIYLISQGFTKSQIQQGASSLTYYTLLAIVPVIALLLGISRGFKLEKTLEEWLIDRFAEQEMAIRKIFDFANAALDQAHQGVIAGVGIALLLWAGIKILMNLEEVMNQVWEIQEGRSFARRFSDYLAMLFICPIIIFVSSGLSGYVSATFTAEGETLNILERLGELLLGTVVPLLLTTLLLTFLYIFMPNTRVRFLAAAVAAFITALIYQVVQWVYLYFQIGVSEYNAIYGTFAALPLFLIWLHLSWVLILLGAKIAFAFQNFKGYAFIAEDIHLSHNFLMILSLRISHLIIKKFTLEEPPPSSIEISNTLSIPLPLTNSLIYQLIHSGIISEIRRLSDDEISYQPAINIDKLTIKRIIDMINTRGEEIVLPPSKELALILKNLEKFSQAIEKSDGNVLLKNI